MSLSHPYLFFINKTQNEIDYLVELFRQDPTGVFLHNKNSYLHDQILELNDSIKKNQPIFYHCVDGIFIKY